MDLKRLHRRFQAVLVDNRLVEPGEHVLVALSGGSDSMALLHLCVEAGRVLGFEVAAAHFDHALRPESLQDAEFVRSHCASLGVDCVVERADVASWGADHGMGLEEAGRHLRHDFLVRAADRLGCRAIALGHHFQDQVETLLHRIARGTGLAGLAAMSLRRDRFIRPLLEFGREELRCYLELERVAFLEDPSNLDENFTRNYLRHTLLPQLSRVNPRVGHGLFHLSQAAGLENDYWRMRIDALRETLRCPEGGWSVEGLLALHPAELRRFLVDMLQPATEGQVCFEHLLAVEKMLCSERPQAELALPGLRVVRRYARLALHSAETEVQEAWRHEISTPGRYVLPEGAELVVSEETGRLEESRWSVVFPLDALRLPLSARTFEPGDRIGLGDGLGHKRLKKLFGELRLEREARSRLPLLAQEGEVLWVTGARRSGKYPCRKGSGPAWRITLEKPESIERLLVKSG